MRYVAKDLAEIADAFDGRAAASRKWAELARTATERKSSEIEARVWEAAAAWLRDTEIAPK